MRFARDPSISRPRPNRAFAVVALALAGCASATAADGGDAAAISYRGGAAQTTLAIADSWPTPCTPTFDGTSLDGANLRVDARAVLSLCAHQATPYTIEVDPAAAIGHRLAERVYHVSYYAANGAQAPAKLRAFALVDTAASNPAPAPESGFWWTTSDGRAGAGRNVFSIEVQGSQLTTALMGYDRDGRGNWQVGAGVLEGRVAHVPLLQLAGGSDPFSGAASAPRGEAGLMLDVEFHSTSQATVWLSRAGGGDDAGIEMQTFEIARLPFAGAADAWTGEWILATDGDTPPQRLRLKRIGTPDGIGFRLSDETAQVAIDCYLDPENAELPPHQCVLRRADGVQLGQFDAVAMTRMDGFNNGKAGLHLLRVSH